MINAAIYILFVLIAIALFRRVPRFVRDIVGVLLWVAAHLDGMADAMDDLFPSWIAGTMDMLKYARLRARGYLAEAKR